MDWIKRSLSCCSEKVSIPDEPVEPEPKSLCLFDEQVRVWSAADMAWFPRRVKVFENGVFVTCKGRLRPQLNLRRLQLKEILIGPAARAKHEQFPSSLPLHCTNKTNLIIPNKGKGTLCLNMVSPDITREFVEVLKKIFTELADWQPGLPRSSPSPKLELIAEEVVAENQNDVNTVQVQPTPSNIVFPNGYNLNISHPRETESKYGGVAPIE